MESWVPKTPPRERFESVEQWNLHLQNRIMELEAALTNLIAYVDRLADAGFDNEEAIRAARMILDKR